ncbi:winged helix-turn-helix domain-containing protein [Vibrio sp. Vb2880]|uniref:winged helix-turn-helix domain-containing protein n=1 Tax=Vibrio sp. Vb2880 TaxID=2816076 RepID=UPI001A8C77BC|nr:helix-turn-helix domain-containing protein [Vibrio sp. Vb2880]MBO0212952.1 winged helix-turn-helix domain-containing protein [Vibrio sp. Vb2880]
MKLLLNHTVIYNSSDGTLKLSDAESDHESLTLTPTANRLLELLSKHHGTPMERDVLLMEGWDKFGLKGSYSSLNQYISQLRKTLHKFTGVDDIILTIPKVGFMLNSEFPIKNMDPEPIAVSESTAKAHYAPKKKVTFKKYLYPFLYTSLFGVLVTGTTIISKKFYQDAYHIGKIEQCDVYNFRKRSDEGIAFQLSILKEEMQKLNIHCGKTEKVFFHSQNSLFYGHSGRLFFSKCFLVDGKFSACENYYYYQWKKNEKINHL